MRPNAVGLDFYSRLVDGMLERGLEPWATLYHWDLPQRLQELGGWNNRATVDEFAVFADAVSRRLGDRVRQLDHSQRALVHGIPRLLRGLARPGPAKLAHRASGLPSRAALARPCDPGATRERARRACRHRAQPASARRRKRQRRRHRGRATLRRPAQPLVPRSAVWTRLSRRHLGAVR